MCTRRRRRRRRRRRHDDADHDDEEDEDVGILIVEHIFNFCACLAFMNALHACHA